MKTRIFIALFVASIMVLNSIPAALGCTNILVTKGASADGSVMITYSADSGGSHTRLFYLPAADHDIPAGGDLMVTVPNWERRSSGTKVRQVPHTYAVLNLMNEHQLTIGETTNGGREELHNTNGGLNYAELMSLALQRCKTAKEAVLCMAELANEYGYGDEGETFSVADKNEIWMMEIIGKGPEIKGAIWVACRVPDGYITAHGNGCRITTFPMDDPESWLYSDDIIDFALANIDDYKPEEGAPFNYMEAYQPLDSYTTRVCGARVWSIYRRAAPSKNFSADYARGVEGAAEYPLFLKPDEKLSVRDVMSLMRDHYEGTPYDMTKGLDAGPFGSPYRWRDLKWSLDPCDEAKAGRPCIKANACEQCIASKEVYCWERPISTQQAGFVMVSQCRDWLPDALGGIYWYTPDDCYTSCFLPFYAGIDRVPRSFTVGDIDRFTWDSAWWVCNFVSNQTYNCWSRIIPDVLAAQRDAEDAIFAMQAAVEDTALKLWKDDPEFAKRYLTTYCVNTAEDQIERWREFGEFIITKFNDGYVRTPFKGTEGVEYPQEWLERLIEDNPEQWKLPKWSTDKEESGAAH